MAEKQTFETVLIKHDKLNATGIEIPFDVEAAFGSMRVPVKAVINDTEYRGSIVRMSGKFMLGIPKIFREGAGIKAGDHIVVTIEKDETSRFVIPPNDLVEALAAAGLTDDFAAMSYTHQKEHLRVLEEAKAPETRKRRIQKALDLIAAVRKKKNA